MGLVFTVARRFRGRGYDQEDLIQIGCIGLLKAIDHFDSSFELRFSTYAVPMISGEIKRFLRDDGIIKVSRSLKETAYKTFQVREELEKSMGREPTVEEVAERMGISREEIVLAMESAAEVESLQKPLYQSDGTDIYLQDRLEEKENANEKLLDRLLLQNLIRGLKGEERRLIYLRYFENCTQNQVGRMLGMSQVQVSRMEKRILKNLRGRL